MLAPAEASSNLARYDGVRYGLRVENGGLVGMYTKTRSQGFGTEVKRRIMLGTYSLSSGYYDAYYGRAQRVRTKIAEDFRAAFADFDFVVTPTSPTVAFELGAKTADPMSMYVNDYCTVPMSLAGIPAISIPNGLSDGLPTGFQLAGPAFSENRILDAAFALEQAIGFDGTGAGGARGMSEFEPVIGLEIHVQLATKTKMFCGCALSFGEPPNTLTCPVCLGLPGTLPRANAQAIHFGLMIGLALGSELAPRSIFHRKNYFYPDLPKGYQISQYDEPLCRGGHLGDVRIHRVHLEEDAAKLVHAGASGRIHGSDASVVDFNRGGTPLAEIVTEPDVRSAAQAREWLTLLRTTLRRLGVSDVNMEEGSLRCDANISIRPVGSTELGTKTELKNMNSFRFIERGINAEVARQEALLRSGGQVVQETLHFDPRTEAITSLRSKEEAHDYRYFPEPDLVPVATSEEMLAAAREAMPELPAAREERLQGLGVSAASARQLAWRTELGDYFEAALRRRAGGNGRRGAAAGQLGLQRARRARRRGGPQRLEGAPRRARQARRARQRQGGDGRQRQARARPARRRGRRPGADRRGRGPRRDGRRRRRAGPDRRGRARRQRRRRREDQGRQHEGDRRDHRPRHARDEGPRRRRRGHAHRAREARALSFVHICERGLRSDPSVAAGAPLPSHIRRRSAAQLVLRLGGRLLGDLADLAALLLGLLAHRVGRAVDGVLHAALDLRDGVLHPAHHDLLLVLDDLPDRDRAPEAQAARVGGAPAGRGAAVFDVGLGARGRAAMAGRWP